MIYIGLDLSMTGAGVVVATKDRVLNSRTISTTSKMKHIKRLDYIFKQIFSDIDTYKPKYAVIEGYAYRARGRSTLDLAELGGVVRLNLAYKLNGYWEVPPKSLKKFICGNGNADKEMMIKFVTEKYGVQLNNHNEYDAYGLIQYVIYNYKNMEYCTL